MKENKITLNGYICNQKGQCIRAISTQNWTSFSTLQHFSTKTKNDEGKHIKGLVSSLRERQVKIIQARGVEVSFRICRLRRLQSTHLEQGTAPKPFCVPQKRALWGGVVTVLDWVWELLTVVLAKYLAFVNNLPSVFGIYCTDKCPSLIFRQWTYAHIHTHYLACYYYVVKMKGIPVCFHDTDRTFISNVRLNAFILRRGTVRR